MCLSDQYFHSVLFSPQDLFGHTVKSFSPTGKLKVTLGVPNQAGTALTPHYEFDHVADLAISETGEVYVVDGDGGMNNRLLKLNKGENNGLRLKLVT